MKKALSLIAGLALAAGLYAKDASSQSIPVAKIDDGRPSIADICDKEEGKKVDWYLDIPILPYTNVGDVTMFKGTYDMVKGAMDLDIPDFDLASLPELERFANDLNTFAANEVNGSLTMEEMLRFGILSDYFEFHAEGGAEGKADFKIGGIQPVEIGDLIIPGVRSIHFTEDQDLFKALAYAGMIGRGSLVGVIPIKEMFRIKPFVSMAYKHREAFAVSSILDSEISSGDDFHITDKGNMRSYGDGFFMDAGLLFDMRPLDPKFVRPVIGFEVENIVSMMKWKENPLNLKNDPLRVNLGLQVSPYNLFDIRADFLNINNTPEYRVEIAKEYKSLEFAAFGRFNEIDLLGRMRHSGNILFGVKHKYVSFGLYGGVDNRKKFSAGIMLDIGYHPYKHGP